MDLVALAQLGDDGPLGVFGVGLLDHRLVLVRVEGLAQGVDRLDAMFRERREQLFVDHLEPLGDPRRGRGPQRVGGALEVVESVEQVAGQGADRVDPIGVGLGFRPLLIVCELGAAALELLEILVSLLLKLGDLVRDRRLRTVGISRLVFHLRIPGFSVVSLIGISRSGPAVFVLVWSRRVAPGAPTWPSRPRRAAVDAFRVHAEPGSPASSVK